MIITGGSKGLGVPGNGKTYSYSDSVLHGSGLANPGPSRAAVLQATTRLQSGRTPLTQPVNQLVIRIRCVVIGGLECDTAALEEQGWAALL